MADGPSGRFSAVHAAAMVAARGRGVPIGAGVTIAGDGDGRADARKAAIRATTSRGAAEAAREAAVSGKRPVVAPVTE